MATTASFVRRENPDSTADMICARCFQTIAKGRDEKLLANAKKKHTCDLRDELYQLYVDSQRGTF
jgi:hypothetical protein